MKRFFYLTIIFLFINPLNAKNVSCEFEEVYQNGDTHQGFFLLNNNQIRYEYYNDNLYTLLYLNEKMYSKYPDIKSKYKFKDYDIKIEKNENFIKRLAIKSSEINLSIYLLNCNFNSIEKIYLNFNPILPYVFN